MRIDRIALAVLLYLSTTTASADDYKCKEADPTTKLVATFGPIVSIHDLSVWILGFTCKNVVFSPDVAKYATKLTVLTPKPMTPKQALQLFVDAIEATGLVVQQKPDTLVIKLGPNMPKNCPDVTPLPGVSKLNIPPSTTNPPDTSDDDVAKAVAAIKKVDDTHYEIPKAVVDVVLANPMAFAKGARVVPAMKNGKPDGFKLYAIRPNSVFAKLGFTNGDTVQAVNKRSLDSVEKALDVYVKVRSATKLEVAIVRRGSFVILVWTIK